MIKKEFEALVAEIGLSAVPEKFRKEIKNVAFIIHDEPDKAVRAAEKLEKDETLLGLYHGIPHTERGDSYGVGVTLPDTIILYQKPIEEAGDEDPRKIKKVIADTVWHEVAHHFGLGHDEINQKRQGC